MADAIEEHPWDLVIFRATKDGNSEASQLLRSTADQRRCELEADGWTVEIITWAPDPTDGPGAWSRWAATKRRHADLRRRTDVAVARSSRLLAQGRRRRAVRRLTGRVAPVER